MISLHVAGSILKRDLCTEPITSVYVNKLNAIGILYARFLVPPIKCAHMYTYTWNKAYDKTQVPVLDCTIT